MTPPINIDGSQVSGVTIDGTDVSEVTVDGSTVFGGIPDSGLEHQFDLEGNVDDRQTAASLTTNGTTGFTANEIEGNQAGDLGSDGYYSLSTTDVNLNWSTDAWSVVVGFRADSGTNLPSNGGRLWSEGTEFAGLNIFDDGTLEIRINDGSNNNTTMSNAVNFDTNQLAAFTHDGGTNGVGYIDNSSNSLSLSAGNPDVNADIGFGARNDGVDSAAPIVLDGLLIYSRQISGSEFDEIASEYGI